MWRRSILVLSPDRLRRRTGEVREVLYVDSPETVVVGIGMVQAVAFD
ncbi:MAG TPA: hypothetical protein PLL78_02755 [Fimbriimonadaceae bacterium]|mgnify:CR=1 FL=1|nr:hypothetical protein [Fimbriimonadaceae bacterium]HRJ95580.1 hypothetical protein [Fimbriimonadaceae bacterium]